MVYSKKVFFKNHVVQVDKHVYEPAEDTFLISELLKVEEDDVVLDVGTGCGILSVLAAEKAKHVVAVDINPYAIECARKNAEVNGVEGKIEFRYGDLFHSIKPNEKFTLILFNAPYLPSEPGEERDLIAKAWAGGQDGRKIIDSFVEGVSSYLAVGGRIQLIQSSLSDVNKTLDAFGKLGLKALIVAHVKVPFENIFLIEARR
jgi:release factor glutamine methyltransferase